MIVNPPAPLPYAGVDLGAIFSRAWKLLRANPVIFMPFVALSLTLIAVVCVLALAGVLIAIHGHANLAPAGDASGMFAVIFAVIGFLGFVMFFAQFALYAALFGLASAAWVRGEATLADARSAIRMRYGQVLIATIGLFGLAVAAAIIAIPTLFVSLLALPVFTIFVYPAVLAGREGFAAVSESIRLVRKNIGISAIAALILFALQYAISFITLPFILPLQIAFISSQPSGPGTHATMPVFPPITIVLAVVGYGIAGLLAMFNICFTAVVQTGLYHALRARAEHSAPIVPA